LSVTTKLDMRELETITRELMPKAEALVDKTAFDVQGHAANEAPFETGALKSSIYTSTSRSDGGMASVAAALAKNPTAKVATIPQPSDDLVAHVGPSVEYGLYQELGTSKMPAHPFMVPSVEFLRPYWDRAWKALFRGYGK